MAWGSRAAVGAVAALAALAGCAVDTDLTVDDRGAIVRASRVITPPDARLYLAGFGLLGPYDDIDVAIVDDRVVVFRRVAHCDGYDVDVSLEQTADVLAITVATKEKGRCDDIGESLVVELTLEPTASVSEVRVEGTHERRFEFPPSLSRPTQD